MAASWFWLGEDVADSFESLAPQLLELAEQASRLGDGVDLGLDKMFAPPTCPVHEPRLLEDRHVFLHCGRAHRIRAGQCRHRKRPAHGPADDVAPGAVRGARKMRSAWSS